MTIETLIELSKSLNGHGATVSILLFVLAIILGWISGVFKNLTNKAALKIDIKEGPTFISTLDTGRTYKDHPEHKTVCAIYLKISNVGYSPATISKIDVGYCAKFSNFIRPWKWFEGMTTIAEDFKVLINPENYKFFPFLFQRSTITNSSSETFLLVGQETTGIAYFEDTSAWGNCKPKSKNGKTNVKIKITDSFDRVHIRKMNIDCLDWEDALKFNDSLGSTRSLPPLV